MKKLIAFITGLLSFSVNVHSTAQNTTDNKSLLWQISGKRLSKPSYLFGTIHMICKDDYLWTDKMKNSLNKSEKVCFEMDLDDPNLMTEASQGMIDQSGKTLKDYFTAEQYQLLKTYVKDSMGVDIAELGPIKPVALQMMMTTQSTACKDPTSYEETIMKTALDAKKRS